MSVRNARFWIWVNGDWVKLTLKPGQSLGFHAFEAHEEGSSLSWETFTHEGDHVVSEYGEDGTDCDGRMSTSGEFYCPLDALTGEAEEHERYDMWADAMVPEWRPARPSWERGAEFRRDYAAEAAGY